MLAAVTGGAGFIGSAVVRRLVDAGWGVRVLDDLSTGREENLAGLRGVEWVRGDIRDPSAVEQVLRGCAGVFHLAAQVGNVRSIEDPRRDAAVNVDGTLVLLEEMRRQRISRLVYSSSAAIYGEARTIPVSETHPAEPDSPYGVAKLAAEKYCLCFGRLFGWSVACLRYFNVYGERQFYDSYGNVIPIFATRLLEGSGLRIFGDGEQTRDFVCVRDVAEANYLAFTRMVSGAFNIASGSACSVNTLARTMGDLWGGGWESVRMDPRPGEVRHSRADISKASEDLGYHPQVGLQDGLRDYLRWFRGRMADTCA